MLTSLSSLRFFLAFAIFLHHLRYKTQLGVLSVTCFFVLSGFLMGYGYKNKFQQLDLISYKQFMINRFARIYPLHFLAFFISIYTMYLTGFKTNWTYSIAHLLLLQTYVNIGNQIFAFSGVSWFLADCFFLYSLTPFLVFFLHKTQAICRIKILVLCAATLICSGFIVAYFFKGNVRAFTASYWFIYISPYMRIFDYGAGLILGIIFSLLVERKVQKTSFLLFSMLEIGGVVVGYLIYKSSLMPIDSLRFDMFWLPVSLLIILIFAFQRGIFSKILTFKLFVRLGELSFPIFMIHLPCITIVGFLLESKIYEAGGSKHFLAQMAVFSAIICIADVVNRYYEIPLKNFVKSVAFNKIGI